MTNQMHGSDAVARWMKLMGYTPASAPAALPTPDAEPRKFEPSPKARAAAKPIDYAATIRLRNELALNMARTMRATFGTITGPDHIALDDHEQYVPRLPGGIGEDLLLDIFTD